MKKLMLDVESLSVESFEVESSEGARGTVHGASEGTYPTDTCMATFLLSGCLSRCRPSGAQNCLSPPPC
ncbi:MAG TPA: hypothetical protein VEQ60_14545 [Longimicrobium sp.]|nr:hypothetical protein [Longimicrobium sp.]